MTRALRRLAGTIALILVQALQAMPASQAADLQATPTLGIRFVQYDAVVPIAVGKGGRSIVRLERAPFDIRLDLEVWGRAWSDSPALQIAGSEDAALFEAIVPGGSVEDVAFLRPGTAVAEPEHGGTFLFTAGDLSRDQPLLRHNYLFDERFNASGPGYLGRHVETVIAEPDGPNLLESADALYLVFYLRGDAAGTLDPATVELVHIELR